MKIEYETIIANANKRKEDLKRIEALVNQAPGVLEKAKEVLEFTVQLEAAYKSLDGEGRKLLPQKLAELLEHSGSTRQSAAHAVANRSSTSGYPFAGLEPIAQFAQPGE